jgi:transcription antitermination factor NusG
MWMVVHVRAKDEFAFVDALRDEGLDAYAPRVRSRSWLRRARVYREVAKPLYVGYVFVHYDEGMRWNVVHEAEGFQYIVSALGYPLLCSDEEMDRVKLLETLGEFDDVVGDALPIFAEGDRVEVGEGVLAGTICKIVSISNRRGGSAEVRLTGGSRSLHVPLSFLRNID